MHGGVKGGTRTRDDPCSACETEVAAHQINSSISSGVVESYGFGVSSALVLVVVEQVRKRWYDVKGCQAAK